MTPTKVLIGQILIVFGIVLAGIWYATEWTAAALGYQMRLGAPWFLLHHVPVYHPWRLFEWWYAYEPYAPGVFTTGGTIAAGSGMLAAAAAILGSVWRARQSKLVTTYGSARWMTDRDVRRAGLARPAGVFLGRVSLCSAKIPSGGDEAVFVMESAENRVGADGIALATAMP